MACAAAQKDFRSSSLAAPPLQLSCGFSPTSVCGSALVRTGHRGGMTAGVTGAPVATGALVGGGLTAARDPSGR